VAEGIELRLEGLLDIVVLGAEVVSGRSIEVSKAILDELVMGALSVVFLDDTTV
jgi:hypothetical protein